MNTNIRWLIHRDMDEVIEIERASYDDPWTEDEFMSYLRQRNVIGQVVERTSYERSTYEILGFMVYEFHVHAMQLLNIAVRPDCRMQGIGASMIDKMKGKMSQQKRLLSVTVRETNVGGQLFFRAMGLRCEEIIRDYYTGYSEDGYEFQYRLAERVQPSIGR